MITGWLGCVAVPPDADPTRPPVAEPPALDGGQIGESSTEASYDEGVWRVSAGDLGDGVDLRGAESVVVVQGAAERFGPAMVDLGGEIAIGGELVGVGGAVWVFPSQALADGAWSDAATWSALWPDREVVGLTAVGDLDGDGAPEVGVLDSHRGLSIEGRAGQWAWADGVSGAPVVVDGRVWAASGEPLALVEVGGSGTAPLPPGAVAVAPAGDVDGDGVDDVWVFGVGQGWVLGGADWARLAHLRGVDEAIPVGDVDGDGIGDLVVRGDGLAVVSNPSGEVTPGWVPSDLDVVAAADVDGDGVSELLGRSDDWVVSALPGFEPRGWTTGFRAGTLVGGPAAGVLLTR